MRKNVKHMMMLIGGTEPNDVDKGRVEPNIVDEGRTELVRKNVSNNPVLHSKTKHMDIGHPFTRDLVKDSCNFGTCVFGGLNC